MHYEFIIKVDYLFYESSQILYVHKISEFHIYITLSIFAVRDNRSGKHNEKSFQTSHNLLE